MLSSSAVFGVAVAIVAVPWITDSSLSICLLAISAAVLLPWDPLPLAMLALATSPISLISL